MSDNASNVVKLSKDNAIVSYKGFNKGFAKTVGICRNHTFEANKEYAVGGTIKTCNNGFHACKNPQDVLQFYHYDNGNMLYAKVKQWGEIHQDSNKTASSHIEVTKFLTVNEFKKILGIDIAKERANDKKRREKAKLAAIKASIYINNKKAVASLSGYSFYKTTIINTVPDAYLVTRDVRNVVSKAAKSIFIGNFRTFKGITGCKFVHTNGKIFIVGKDGIKANVSYELKKGKLIAKAA